MISLKEKLVCVLGAGVEGLSSAAYLKKAGAYVTVLDQKTKDQLDPEIVEKLASLSVETDFSPDCLKNLTRYEILVRTPGIRPDLPELQQAVASGKILTSNTKLFFDACPAQIIGVTGTKGKGTTATLITEILKRDGKKVFLGGNIGTPALDLLPSLSSSDLVVLELSSFQLFDLDKSPQVAVVLMVTSEHLDWHKDATEYKEAKFNIAKYQNPQNFAIVNIDHPVSKEFLDLGSGKKIPVSTKEALSTGVFISNGSIYRRVGAAAERVIGINEVGLIGPHNLENIVAAVGATSALGVGIAPISEAVRQFKGLEHRLELVREVNGVKYFNDSFSTTPETAIAAIKSFTEPEIVILGGSDKGSDYTELGQTIVHSANIKAIILIGQMAVNIKTVIEKAGEFKGQIKEGAKNMAEIIAQAKEVAAEGDVVLLSPGCASFDMFPNYKQRGLQFKEVVNKL